MTNIPRTPEQSKWRKDAALAMWHAGYKVEADALYYCGDKDKFSAYAVCRTNHKHHAIPILDHCRLRFCAECETRAQAKRMERYKPLLEQCGNFGKRYWSIKHLILTTPFDLRSPTIKDDLTRILAAIPVFFERLFYEVMQNFATPAEKRRARVSLKRLGIGALCTFDFGENGLKLHFHNLLYCPFIPKRIIDKHWHTATGGTCEITYINKVKDWHEAAKEVILKYATKLSTLSPTLVPVLHSVLLGVRRIRCYGLFYNIPEDETPYHVCPVCDSGLRYIHRVDYEILVGKEIPSLVHTTEISRGNSPPKTPNLDTESSSQSDSVSEPTYLTGFDKQSLPEPRNLDRFFDQPRK